MPYQLGGRPLKLDVPWEHDGVQYPANWLRLSTAQDRAELGITWVDNSPKWYAEWTATSAGGYQMVGISKGFVTGSYLGSTS